MIKGRFTKTMIVGQEMVDRQCQEFLMSISLSSLRVFLLSLVAILMTCNVVSAAEMRLRLAHVFPQNTTVGEAADEFARLINERTDGRISIAVFPAGQLGGDEAIGRDLKRGSLDLAFLNPNSLVGLDPLFDFHILPYIATDYETADRIFYNPDGVIQRTLNETLERNGMRALGYFENDFRTVSNSQREITKLSDLEGLKLRVVPSQSLKMFFQKAGVNVV
ncbi:MAG: TRAP transporter substrate-binding protein, partial [Marinobacter sp.]|nr:TRAP transporter substrate-binding protein [Marinobacter sp.]